MDIPSTVTIVFVLTVTINGEDVTHREKMKSLTECWEEARQVMAEGVTFPNDGPEVRQLKAGCFAYIEPTPEH